MTLEKIEYSTNYNETHKSKYIDIQSSIGKVVLRCLIDVV